MPRSQGTSRKGKPKKSERAAGMGRALERSQKQRYKPKSNGSSRGGGGMAASGATSIGMEADQNQPKIKSVLEMDNLTDFILQSEMANREFASEKEQFIVLDPTSSEYNPNKPTVRFIDDESHRQVSSNFQFKELSVPRRPKWTSETTAEELHQMENETFLEWRRGIAKQEELLHTSINNQTVVTPFEKNLEVWKQLWRVLERSACLIQIVDARNPLFYFSEDLRAYSEDELGKPMLLVINKSDYLTHNQRRQWNKYFTNLGINHIFFSAYEEQQILDGEAQRRKREIYSSSKLSKNQFNEHGDKSAIDEDKSDENYEINDEDNIGVDVLMTREGLLSYLHAFALSNSCKPSTTSGRIEFGTIGFPNVGKSSIINVLIGVSKHEHNMVRVGVAAQPGKTKHFQTILLSEPNEDMMLCDCPGLVFPSFVSSTADLIAAGVFPLSQMRDTQAKDVISLICKRIPAEVLEAMYGIQLQLNSIEGKVELNAELLLDTFCVARKMLNASSGTPDHQRAGRIFIKDYVSGKLLYCHAPNYEEQNMNLIREFEKETFSTLVQKTKKVREKLVTSSESKNDDITNEPSNITDETLLETEGDIDILDLLDEFDDNDGEILKPESKNKSSKKKHHNKPQGKKWGKKGKKYRNKDPYGCHSDPDPLLSIRSSGAIADGKYGGQYSRPNYAGTKNAIPFQVKQM